MLIENKNMFTDLIEDLEAFIKANKIDLFESNRKTTLDTEYYIEEDYQTVRAYLNYFKNNYPTKLLKKIKPKGKILIILSHNEPFILSIIPVLNALVIGNKVILKPSQGAESFVKIIWQKSGVSEKYGLKLQIISPNTHKEVTDLILGVRAVYFFGSYKVAQSLAKICGERYVEFYPEIETSDVKIFNKNSSVIRNDVLLTLKESFSHSGQSCQRIQGIFVHEHVINNYVQILKQEFIKLCHSNDLNKFIDNQYVSVRKNLLDLLRLDIKKSEPTEILEIKNLPILVIKPKARSEFVKNAYFLPVLWILPFNRGEDLIKTLNSRKFFLGINIQSDKDNFINQIINNTRFTRYTVNTSHTNIRLKEGWGGSWPSGFSGYRSWIEHFSDGYTIINK
ncbi:MAG: Aldehyde dehydrogenase [Berkelbacteria bacterium GW2011_GWA2_38_9]|uniref:Aldehyde dehydrogenase n=1 Tax=Berkelbacteria bacterium GW2011_GWA2_38_9 TaxID=1618334 RepID=A0A0G0LII6_9BACT|nr:MAG: Aldehyde dehydrogenase [Berkelbacteria bacterium GW2011_GWA2_38_9]